jgi:hypothetical protein
LWRRPRLKLSCGAKERKKERKKEEEEANLVKEWHLCKHMSLVAIPFDRIENIN